MPALVNYGGDDDFCYGLGRCYSIKHPSKRARVGSGFFGVSKLEQNQQVSIDVLPDECLFEIFKRVAGARERSASACVSKRWLMLLSSIRKAEFCKSDDVEMVSMDENEGIDCDGCLTRSLEGKKATDTRLAAIAVGTGSLGGLGKLVIRGTNSFNGVSDIGFSSVARGCPSLKALSLWNTPLVGDEGLAEIAKECCSLEKLNLCNCPSISSKGLIAIAENCPNLTTLSIESCPKICNDGLQAVGKLCTNLQSVSVKDCSLIGDHGVSSLLTSASALTKVKLQSLNITDFSLAVIGHYGKAISSLVLLGLRNVSERGFWVMGNAQGLKKLVSLTIASCQGVTDLSLEAFAKGFTNLKQISLRRCWFVSDNGVFAFAKAAESIESLQFEECNRVTQSGVIAAIATCGTKLKALSLVKCVGIRDIPLDVSVLPSCSSLRHLSIRNCPGFGSGNLATIGKLCPQLQHIDLSGLCGVTDAGILSLLDSSTEGLVKVNLSGCLSLTDKAVSTLTKLHGSSLELLNLEGCRKITDTSLFSIAQNCLFLSDLDVSNCAITDSGVAMLANAEQLNIQVLALSGCSEVSNKSVPCLKKLGRTLLGLNLKDCSSISSSSIELLVESLWRCDILS